MAYTGAWRRNREAYRQQWDDPLPPGRPPNTLHDHTDPRPGGARPPWAVGNTAAGVPPALTDDGGAYAPMRGRPGLPRDMSPTGHDVDPSGGSQTSVRRAQLVGNRMRGRDYGAARARLTRPLERDDGKRETVYLQVEPSTRGSRAALVRGKNSYPENNPDGYRLGGRVFRRYDRRIPMMRLRHNQRMILPRLAATASDSPALPRPNRYTSPYGTLTVARRRNQQSPQVRRTPLPTDESVAADGQTDGTFYTAAQGGLTSWGL